jgi:NTE family protein
MNEKLGMVLSGGGVRGIVHIGFLKALEENGIHPQVLSGASAGALVGALYAAGYSSEEMVDFFKTTPIFKFSFYSSSKPGLLDSEKYRVFFEKYFPVDNFAALKKPLTVVATDLANAHPHFFRKGAIIKPLLASAALPPLFTPVEINGKLYADGGIMNNFPVEPLENCCDRIIGSFANPVKPMIKKHFTNTMKIFQRAADLRFYADAKSKFHRCDYVFEPQALSNISLLDTRNIDKAFEIGYQTALEGMVSILNALHQQRTVFYPEKTPTPTKEALSLD